MKKTSVLIIFGICITWFNCSDESGGGTFPVSTGNPTPGAGEDSLTTLCQEGCEIDSSAGYTKTGNQVAIISVDSSGEDTLKLNFTTVNDQLAIAEVDTSLISGGGGEAQLVFERITGSGNNLEDDLWRLDTIRIANDSLGIDAAIPVPGDMLFVLDSQTGDVLSAYDTSTVDEQAQELLVSAAAACPLLLLAPAVESSPLVAPLDTIDIGRSDCDTTWGYKQGDERYVTSNGVDSLFVHEASAGSVIISLDLNILIALLQLSGGLQGGLPTF